MARENGVRNETREHRFKPSQAATAIVILVLLGMAGKMLLWRGQIVPLDQIFMVEHIEMLGMVDNTAQRVAYRAGLVLLAVLTLAGRMVVTRRAGFFVSAWATRAGEAFSWLKNCSGVLIFVAVAVVFVFMLQGTVFPVIEGRKWRLGLLLVSVYLVLGAMMMAKRLKTRPFAVAVWGCVIAYSLFLIVPGLARPLFLFEPLLSGAEWHYSVTLAQGDRLAAGLSLGSEVNLNYGLIPQVTLAIIERGFGLLNFGEHIRLVQLTQIAFLFTAIVAFWLWQPHNNLFILFATLLIGPWLSTSHMAVYHPNQAGWRSLTFPVGVVFLLLMRRQTRPRSALLLGCMAVALVLYNPETGLCLSFGYGLFLLSRLERLRLADVGAHALRACIGAALALLALLLLYRVGLGGWPALKPASLFGFITRFGTGYGSLPLYFDPLAAVMFVHSAYIVALTTLRWRRGDALRFEESVKLALSTTILLWFTYYINRPHPWNLWTYKFLYVFLVADFLAPRFLKYLWRRGVKAFAGARLATVTFILLPMILTTNHYIFTSTMYPPIPPADNRLPISGLLMTKATADALRAKADFLVRQDTSSTLYITRHSYSLSLLTGHFIRLPVQDVFAETITKEDFERRIAEIQRVSPRVILIDAPDEKEALQNPAISYYTRFFTRLQERLSARYLFREATHGWQVWELRGL